MIRILKTSIILAFYNANIIAQVAFEAPDTLCIGDSMEVINLSRDANSYYWNFCSGNLSYEPDAENIGNIDEVESPVFMEIVKDDNNYFAFITNYYGSIVRCRFGDNLLNDPVSENLGNFDGILPGRIEGIQIIKDGSNWYGFVTGGIGESSALIKLEFGNFLTNQPVAENMGNIGELDQPLDLFIFNTEGEWFGYTVNYSSNTITRFDFGNNLQNIPSGINLGNIGNLNLPCGIHPIQENGEWYMFITNFGSNTITRLDFGNSILNTPTGINLGGSQYISSPYDITIVRDCERSHGFVVNHYNNTITRIYFGQSISNIPDFELLGNFGNLNQPHGFSKVFREGNNLYLFIANLEDNSFTRLIFPGCENAIPPYSNQRTPGKITYDQSGEYNVVLVLDEGMPTSEIYCKPVIAFDNPEVSLGNDTSILPGTSITLSPGNEFIAYNWSTNETTYEIVVDLPGEYLVEVTDSNGCKNSAMINISIQFYIPEFFTPNGDGTNDTWEVEYLKNIDGVQIYIYDRFGKLLADDGQSWDGTYNGRQMPADSYWYLITFNDGTKPIKGFFSIIR